MKRRRVLAECVAENLLVTRQGAATNVAERENQRGTIDGRPFRSIQKISPLFRATERASPNFGGGLVVSIKAFGQRANGEPCIRLYYLYFVRLLAAVLDFGSERTN